MFLLVGVMLLLFGTYLYTKFKDIEIELGTELTKNKFIAYGTASGIDIDLSKVDCNKVGEYLVPLKILFVRYDLKANVVDKTPPVLKVHDVSKSLDYVVDVADFILDVSDKSEYEVYYQGNIDTSKYGEYNVSIIAKDIYGNSDEQKAKLSIGWVKNEYSIEVGNDITIKDLVYDINDVNTISQKDLDEINNEKEGIYYLTSTKNDNTIKIKIQKMHDVTPPELLLKNVTIYLGKKIKSINDFISKVSDKSGKVTLDLLTHINYDNVGEQKVSIEAVDIYGNKIIKETTLNIIKDTIGPKISGLTKITIDKGKEINYISGVSSYDDNTGKCEYSVDSSKVNNKKYGTYYAIYTSTDALGNKTSAKRVIIVNHDQNDTNDLVKKIADTLPNDAEKIRDYVRNNIKYNTNWGGDDPIWYGLNNKVGNCFVHASVFEAILKLKGYTTQLIWTTEKGHYWNMVYLNGKWVHMDSTPRPNHTKYSTMNDSQRIEGLSGRDWDRSLWPKAE